MPTRCYAPIFTGKPSKRGQRPGRGQAATQYTCARFSAQERSNTTPVHVRALTEHETLHLCMFERLRSTKHYTYADSSAQVAFGSTMAQRKHFWTRLRGSKIRKKTSNESTLGHGCTFPECDMVARLHGSRIWSRRCTCHDSNYDNKAEMRFPIMATKPKRSLNTLELRLYIFGAAQTLWSYACACLEQPKRFGATPVHVRCSTRRKKIQEIMK